MTGLPMNRKKPGVFSYLLLIYAEFLQSSGLIQTYFGVFVFLNNSISLKKKCSEFFLFYTHFFRDTKNNSIFYFLMSGDY